MPLFLRTCADAIRMFSGVNGVRSSGVSVMGGLLMMFGLVMLSRFPVISMRKMF